MGENEDALIVTLQAEIALLRREVGTMRRIRDSERQNMVCIDNDRMKAQARVEELEEEVASLKCCCHRSPASEDKQLREENMHLEVSLRRMTKMRDDLLVSKEERGITIESLVTMVRSLKAELFDVKASNHCSE